eukprot:6190512-Pleurochrysis_carterae.AAC.3
MLDVNYLGEGSESETPTVRAVIRESLAVSVVDSFLLTPKLARRATVVASNARSNTRGKALQSDSTVSGLATPKDIV